MSEAKLREALEFYADPNRYNGANQRNDGTDRWSGDKPYIQDVTRDGGAIAREALADPTEAVELTNDELLVATLGWREYDRPDNWPKENETRTLYGAGRAAIAAHEAKRIQS